MSSEQDQSMDVVIDKSIKIAIKSYHNGYTDVLKMMEGLAKAMESAGEDDTISGAVLAKAVRMCVNQISVLLPTAMHKYETNIRRAVTDVNFND